MLNHKNLKIVFENEGLNPGKRLDLLNSSGPDHKSVVVHYRHYSIANSDDTIIGPFAFRHVWNQNVSEILKYNVMQNVYWFDDRP